MLSDDENEKILHEELESLREDILKLYNSSGKRTTGEFETGLEIVYSTNKATLLGYEYLGGRKAGKMPPIAAIEKWINDKGITPTETKMSISSLAFLIARKIANEGTAKENNLSVYTEVITPERIQQILDKVSQLNANAFIQDVTATITKAFSPNT